MKNLLFLSIAMAMILPARAQVYAPDDHAKSSSEHFQQKLLFGPVPPGRILSAEPGRDRAAYPENNHKPFIKGSYDRDPSFDSAWAEKFQARLDNIVAMSDMPGASLAVYAPGQGIFTGVSGISTTGVPITSDMRFGMASNTKLFVAVALVMLQEQGVLSLDDHLYQWLPSYPFIDSTATIRQLLSHQTGFFDFWNDNPDAMIFDSIWADTSRFWTADEMLTFIGPPHFAPGHGYQYSNTNYLLAAMVIEAATGEAWVRNLHSLIFDPLEMDSTFVGAFEPRNGPVAAEWDVFNSVVIKNSPMTAEYSQAGAAGAVLSTAREMVTWYSTLFGSDMISPSSMEQVTDFDPIGRYGLGLQGSEVFGHKGYWHVGRMFGYTSLAYCDVQTGAALCVQYNSRDDDYDISSPLLIVLTEDYPKQETDAGIEAIISPWSNICNDDLVPLVVLANAGSDLLTSVDINYFVDSGPVSVMHWTGSLGQDNTVQIYLPEINAGDGFHTFTCYTSGPNGMPEGYSFNDTVVSNFIVNTTAAINAPIMESFEGNEFPPEGWSKGSCSMMDWSITPLVAYSGTHSAIKNNWQDGSFGYHYDLDLPPINISYGSDTSLDFKYAYAMYPNAYGDSLQVLISADCGESWGILFNKGGAGLATTGSTRDPFFPKATSQWKNISISLAGYTGEVLIRFRAINGNSNNLYLDDIMVNTHEGIDEIAQSVAFTVFPNPVSSELHVSGLPVSTEIYLTDITGRSLIHNKTENTSTGLDMRPLPDGIYILKTPFGSKKIVKI